MSNLMVNINLLNIFVFLIILLIVYALANYFLKKRGVQAGRIYKIVLFVFIAYITGIIFISFMPNPVSEYKEYNAINVRAPIDIYYAYRYKVPYLLEQYILNIILYIPLGVFLPFLFKVKKGYLLLIILLCTVVIELGQWLFPFSNRIFDFDDVICNFIGGCTGVMIYNLLYAIIHYKTRSLKFVFLWSFLLALCAVVFVFPFTASDYDTQIIDSPMFVPQEIEFSSNLKTNINKANIYEVPQEPFTVPIAPNNAKGFRTIEEKDLVPLPEILNRAKYSMIENIYTEGIPHPDRIVINDIELTYSLNKNQTILVPVWKLTGKVFKNQSYGEESKTTGYAEILIPAL